MSFQFTCQVCGRELKADERAIGRKVRCPDCATLLIIPDPGDSDEDSDESPTPDDELPANIAEQAASLPFPPEASARAATYPPEPDLAATTELEPLPNLPPSPTKGRDTRQAPSVGRASGRPKQPFKVTSAPAEPTTAAAATSAASAPNSAFSIQHSAFPPPPHDDAPLLPPPQPHPEDLIDMTAMVDIVFFLLIFFLVTSLQALEAVMNMPTPQAGEAGVSATGKSVADLENDPNFITVRIEDDDSIWVENTQVFNDQELAKQLRDARKESDTPKSLLVIGDADASHGTAVRVFDAGAAASVSGISLIVQEKGDGSR